MLDCCCERKSAIRHAGPGQEVVRRGMPQGTPGGAQQGQPGRVAANLGGVGVVFQAGATGEGLVVASLANDGPAGQSGQVPTGMTL